ncbi:MAG: THUMP domain-containing protein [Melioribacteraceae bacterium]|nr:MAG: THUMP domain-containing protein [Melioribacteraceae bacterium]
MYNYQKSNRYFAQVADDIKDITADELESLGATGIKEAYKGVYFNASQSNLYKINLYSSLINRILAPLYSFDCHSENYLYKTAYDIEWEKLFSSDETFAVFASTINSNINHSKFAALKLKDAIVDRFRNTQGKRPNVDTRNPDVWFNLFIENNHAVISLDTSGGSLHRRGYRKESVEAPMIETLAASLLKISGWNGTTDLYDPFCGSGTILCEAYLHVTNTPTSINRKKFGFEKLPDFNSKLWKEVKAEALDNIKEIRDGLISGSDVSKEAIKAAQINCNEIDKSGRISLRQTNLFDIKELNNKTIICNPPFGIRLKHNQDLSDFYKQFGDFLKQKCKGSTAYIYFGDREYIKKIGLRTAMKRPLQNGGLDGRLAKFELY